MIRREQQPVIGRAGVLAASVAAALVLGGWARLVSVAEPPSPVMILAICGANLGMIVTLCRVRMPAQLRGPLVLGLIGLMFFAVARGDVSGTHGMGARIAGGMDGAFQDGAAIDRYATGRPELPLRGSSGGAVVALSDAAGAAHWADEANQAWNGRIQGPGAQALRITGTVRGTEAEQGRFRVVLDWSISRDYVEVRCGRTSSMGRDRAQIIEALGEPMVQAVRRSIALGRASCP